MTAREAVGNSGTVEVVEVDELVVVVLLEVDVEVMGGAAALTTTVPYSQR